ncbi:MAG: PAS domain S-box protein [Pseudomonadota bacterium]
METSIHILHLEDDPADAELVQAALVEAGLACRVDRAQTRAEFETGLGDSGTDIILADYKLPAYDGLSALRLAQEHCPEIPFIFVSGTMGEEAAIEALTHGATDYVLKQNLARLATAVQRALQEARIWRERRQAREALHSSNEMLKASEARYIDLYDNAPDMYLSADAQTAAITTCNQTLADTLGYPKAEIIGRSIYEIYHPACLDRAKQAHTEFLERGEIHDRELQLRKKDGSKLDVSLNVSAVRAKDGAIVSSRATLRDITERKQAEASIRQLSQAIEQSPVSIVITNTAGSIEFVNAKFTQVTGYAVAEALGQNPRILKSGETAADEYERLWKTISSGGVWRGEFINRKKNGELFREQATIAPVRNADNLITHYVAVKEDITERKNLEAQLSQAQKMEVVGQLAGGVAHDFNNMLGVIIGYTEMLLELEDLDDLLREYLDEILAAGHRSTDITRQLLAFARKQTVVPKILDLNETVERMLKMLRRLIGEHIELAWLPGAKLWPVKMDPSQIDQILANLCVNARDAIAGVGNVTIETQTADFDEVYCADHRGFIPGEYVVLAVSDNGSGMDKPTMDKIFEPFFTTKPVGKGTGLGLATVYGIVKQNDGFINVTSGPGHGSTFKIYLPRYTVAVGQALAARHTPSGLMGHATILIVEDEISHLTMVKLILEGYGYRVLAASTPDDALLMASEYSGGIHLLLTDVVMPEMNGLALANKMTALLPDILCLYMSGYSGDIIAHHGIIEAGGHFIQKPFSKQALAEKVREVLAGK